MTGVVGVLLLVCAAPVDADVVVRNVTIHDGAGEEAQLGDIAVKGDRLVGVGSFEVTGSPREIDGTGLFACPGFIDLHNHSDRSIQAEATRLNKNYLTQGVTTIVTGNCGGGVVDVGRYLRHLDEHGAGTNVAHLIPQGSVRRQVMGRANRPASPDELARMKRLIEQGMQAGAFGVSTGLIYVPSKYANMAELIELASVAAAHGGIYVSHMRNENTGLLESIDETLQIGREAGIPVHISHFKASGRAAWGLAADAIRKIDEARAAGRQVTADQYPYIASSTSLGAMVVPDAYRETGRLIEALEDAAKRDALRARIADSIRSRQGGASLFIASYSKQPEWQGQDLASLSQTLQRSVLELVIEIQRNGGAQMVNFGMSEEEVRLIMQQPFVAVASDGGAKVPNATVPHPRNYGTFPRKIGEYALRRQIISVPQAIRSATGLPADILGLTDRGYLRAGYIADVAIIDPDQFIDTATFQKPHQYSTGVEYLFVNGELSIASGDVTGVLAGRALRETGSAGTGR